MKGIPEQGLLISMSFTIITDTSANLSADYLESEAITAIPYKFSIGGEEHTCTDLDRFDREEAESFYASIKNGAKVNTSQITPAEFEEAFEPELKAGRDVLFISMSSGISGSFDSCTSAIKELEEKYPDRRVLAFDTLAASLGEGLAVLHAVRCRDKGMSIDETLAFLERKRARLYQVVLVEDLMHLHRGGRISAPKALLGTVLGIRPILKGDEKGHLVVRDKVRGRKKGLAYLAEKYAELVDRGTEQTVCIAFTDCLADALELGERIKGIFKPGELVIKRYEPVTGKHIGPGTVALFFEGREGVRAL